MKTACERGASRKRAKKAAAAAAASPPSLSELILLALTKFADRGKTSFYRSMLRQEVTGLDTVRPKCSFGDKGEWKAALATLEKEGKLTYSLQTDTITLPTEPPEAAGSAVEEVGDTSSDESGDRPIIPWMSAARARIRDAISELQEQEQDEFSVDDFFVKVFPNLMTHATPQKERATAMHFLMKELNRLEDDMLRVDDIEDVMTHVARWRHLHFVKPPSS